MDNIFPNGSLDIISSHYCTIKGNIIKDANIMALCDYVGGGGGIL